MRNLAAGAFVLAVSVSALVGVPATAGGPSDPAGGETALGKKAGLKYLSETLDVGSSGHFSGATEAAWIACGSPSSDWSPTAGGGKVSGAPADNALSAIRPMDLDDSFESPGDTKPDDWWDTTVRSVLGRTLTGYAICTERKLRYERVQTPASPGPGRTGSAECPSGRTLVGGGAFIATSNSWINASFPGAGNTWKSRVLDMAGGSGGMETYAVCRTPGGVRKVGKTSPTIAATEDGSAVAKCPSTRHVIGGGGKVSGSIGAGRLAASHPVDGADADSTPDDGWKVSGYNATGPDKKVTAYALCVRKG
jgi:hypothetical protein